MVNRHSRGNAPVTLVQETGKNNQAGFLIYLPYYKKAQGTPTGTKNKAINGFVYAAFRAGDLMQTVLSEKPAVEVGIRAYSGVVKPQNLLYANVNSIADPSVHTIQLAGRKWIFELEDHSIQRWNFWNLWQIVLGLGLLLSLAFALFLKNQTEHAENAELISQAARARALEKDILLKEMTHRLKNAISRIVSIARMSSKGTSSKEEFVTSLTGRLQAMAAAQELLANSSAQKMNIRDLIHKEFDLIFGTTTGRVKVQGSGITINEVQSQALGLIVHELATNSTKYGAFKGDGKITVQLRKIKLETGKFDAHISWMETGIDGTAEFSREGFGSKLLKMMVEGQLNGRINRVPSPGQLLISIQFPMSD